MMKVEENNDNSSKEHATPPRNDIVINSLTGLMIHKISELKNESLFPGYG